MYGIFLILLLSALQIDGFCPNGCQCDDVMLRVHCVNANLEFVPILLNPRTRHLDLSHNHIKEIIPGFAFYHDMQYLDMSHNDVESLGSESFSSQGSLTTLIFSNNKISQILGKTFQGLTSLKEIDLSDNYIDHIDSSAFKSLKGLKILDLSNNRIKTFFNNTFQYLRGLKVLNICKNNLAEITVNYFKHLEELHELHLCSNNIETISDYVFKTLKNLEHLSLYGNKIGNFMPKSLVGLAGLKLMDVHDNLLKTIPSHPFSVLNSLEELNIGNNSIVSLTSNQMGNLSKLKSLYVSHCSFLNGVENDTFSRLESLMYLEISFNTNLTFLPSELFKPLKELRSLILKGNSLKTIKQDLVNWQSLQYLDVRDNPLHCNCSMKWLQDAEKNQSVDLKIEEIFCSFPESLNGRLLANLTDYELECYSQLLIIASCVAVTIAFIVLVTIIGVIYYRHCKKMKTLVHDHWPEKIVATWRDPEYEKQIEDEEYTFQSARSVSHVQIPVI